MAGVSQPSPLTPARQRAQALADSGDRAGAVALLEHAVGLGRTNLGEDDPDVVAAAHQLARLHQEMDDPSAARRVLEEAYAGGQWRLGDSDPLMLEISYDLGVVAEELGNRHEARKALGRVVEAGQPVLGDFHWAVVKAKAYLDGDTDAVRPPPMSMGNDQQGTGYEPLPPLPRGPRNDARPPLPRREVSVRPAAVDPGEPAREPGIEPQSRRLAQPEQHAPIQQTPVHQTPVQQTPVQQTPVQQTPAQETVQRGSAQQPAIQQAAVQQMPVQQPAIPQAPIQPAPVQQEPAARDVQQMPVQPAPAQPVQQMPLQQMPLQQLPAQQLPPLWDVPVTERLPAVQRRPNPGDEPTIIQPRIVLPEHQPPLPPVHRIPLLSEAPAPSPVPPAYKRGPAIFAAIAAVLAAIIAVAALVFVLAQDGGGSGRSDVPTLGGGPPPADLRVRDFGTSVVVSWSDPGQGKTSFIITGGHPGEVLKPMGEVGPGETSFKLQGLNDQLDYCFAVLAVYSTTEFASSAQACTSRPEPTATD